MNVMNYGSILHPSRYPTDPKNKIYFSLFLAVPGCDRGFASWRRCCSTYDVSFDFIGADGFVVVLLAGKPWTFIIWEIWMIVIFNMYIIAIRLWCKFDELRHFHCYNVEILVFACCMDDLRSLACYSLPVQNGNFVFLLILAFLGRGKNFDSLQRACLHIDIQGKNRKRTIF